MAGQGESFVEAGQGRIEQHTLVVELDEEGVLRQGYGLTGQEESN
jgi:hypothetical protein